MPPLRKPQHRSREVHASAVPEAGDMAADSTRGASWMMVAMIACCAAIPLALVMAALVGGSALSVSVWGWVVLGTAAIVAMLMVVRVMRRAER